MRLQGLGSALFYRGGTLRLVCFFCFFYVFLFEFFCFVKYLPPHPKLRATPIGNCTANYIFVVVVEFRTGRVILGHMGRVWLGASRIG